MNAEQAALSAAAPRADGRLFTVCVFCASSERIAQIHRDTAARLGTAIADQGWAVVYGGGGIGLMGELARAALAAGARVTGVIPHKLAAREIALLEVSELIRTDTMRERKAEMDARSDAFVVLPGGIGTLEELVEVITLRQLGYHDRPIVILDDAGYWGPLLGQLERMVDDGFAAADLLDLYEIVSDVPRVIAALRRAQPSGHRPSDDEALEAVEADPSGA